MQPVTDTEERTLALHRMIEAPRTRVFAACVAGEHLFGAWRATDLTMEPVEHFRAVGDGYRFTTRAHGGKLDLVRGTCTFIEPPSRLLFTWLCEDEEDTWCDTVVSIRLEACGDSTRITLEQATFSSPAHCAAHVASWRTYLDRLARSVSELERAFNG